MPAVRSSAGRLPSEATFSRAFSEFAESRLANRLHEVDCADDGFFLRPRDASDRGAGEGGAEAEGSEAEAAQAGAATQGRGAGEGAPWNGNR